MKTQVNLKIDSNVKRSAQKRAAEIGLSLSSIVNVTLKQFARTGELELSVCAKGDGVFKRFG
jgi:addiction module RelB/DinJ family antitoxin